MRANPSVLVTGDDSDLLDSFVGMLRALGVERICRVYSAGEALDLLQERPFTLLLADSQMADMDEAEFIERARAVGHSAPIVTLSEAHDQAGVFRAKQYQGTELVREPFRLLDFVGVGTIEQFARAA